MINRLKMFKYNVMHYIKHDHRWVKSREYTSICWLCGSEKYSTCDMNGDPAKDIVVPGSYGFVFVLRVEWLYYHIRHIFRQ